jgi:hypothetical protein
MLNLQTFKPLDAPNQIQVNKLNTAVATTKMVIPIMNVKPLEVTKVSDKNEDKVVSNDSMVNNRSESRSDRSMNS